MMMKLKKMIKTLAPQCLLPAFCALFPIVTLNPSISIQSRHYLFSSFCILRSCYCLVIKSYLTLCDPMDCRLPGSSVHGIFPGQNTGVGCHFLLQGIFLTQVSNPCLLPQQVDSLQLSPLRSPVDARHNIYIFILSFLFCEVMITLIITILVQINTKSCKNTPEQCLAYFENQ